MRMGVVGAILLFGLSACGSSSAASSGALRTGTDASTSTQPASPPRTTRSCGPGKARTVAASEYARVYASAAGVYGCTYASGRSYRLAASRSIREGRVGPVAVAGHDAAYVLTSFGIDTGTASLVVRDLASGQVLHDVPAIHRPLPEAFQSVGSLVVKADGAVAWTAQVNSVVRRGAGGVAVMRLDAHGQKLLDSGPAIDPGSLRLRGSRLTWRDGSRTRSATLA